MDSTNPYLPYHDNFGEQKGLEWMTEDGSYQHTTISESGHVASSQLEADQNWVLQQLEDLMAVRAHIDAKLRELKDLYRKQQDTLARLGAFNATTATATLNIPPPTTSTSASTAPYAQSTTYPPSIYTSYNHAGKKAFGYKTSRQGEVTWHHETLEHAKKNHICHCGKSYTRKDSLLRHAIIHTFENQYL